MDLRPSTLKALFLEGMRQANGEDDAPETPPPPAAPPTVRPPAPGRAAVGYMGWRDGKPYDITPPPPEPDPDEDEDDDQDDDQDDEPGDEDEAGEEGSGKAARTGRRWLYGSGKKQYRRPVYAQNAGPKQSLLGWWGSMAPTTRHGLYNGAALALGLWVGVPQFVTAEVAHLVATYHSWTAFYVWFWYFVAAAIWALDYKARSWLPPLAFLARVPLVSMIIGALLYGGSSAL